MGQSQSSIQAGESPKLNLRRSFRRNLNSTKTGSKSLPASPEGRKKVAVPDDMDNSGVSGGASALLKGFESVFGNLDLQWPTWAKRRGWVADLSDPNSADSSGRVVQLGKDTWVFHRGPLRKKEVHTQTEKEEETTTTGQRSRRSSGYASASSSPVTLRQKPAARTPDSGSSADSASVLEAPVIPADLSPVPADSVLVIEAPGLVDDVSSVSADSEPLAADPWRASLYEVTLRWMFHTEDSPEIYETSVCEPVAVSDKVDSQTSVRVHIRLFRQTQEDTPLFIDFQPIPSSTSQGKIQYHAIVPADCDNSVVLDRECTCSELLSAMLILCPSVCRSVQKVALYEKTWRPGKTSRARIQRLADGDYPFLLVQKWKEDSSDVTKTLLLQEIQSGDIPWEEFTIAELSSFLRVLDREEEIHRQQITERYKQLAKNIQAAMQYSRATE